MFSPFRFLSRFPALSRDGVVCLGVGGQGRSCNPEAAGKCGFCECRSLFCMLSSGSVVRKLVCLARWGVLTCGWLHVASREIMLISTPDICGPWPAVSRRHALMPLLPTLTSSSPPSMSVCPYFGAYRIQACPTLKSATSAIKEHLSCFCIFMLVAFWMEHRDKCRESFSAPQIVPEKVGH